MLQIPFLMFSRVGESASTIYKNDFCSLERADHTFCVFTNGRGRFYYSQNVFTYWYARRFHHLCFHEWEKALLLFAKCILISAAGPTVYVFTNGRRCFCYSRNDFYSLTWASPLICVFASGRRRFYYSQNVFLLISAPPVLSFVFLRFY